MAIVAAAVVPHSPLLVPTIAKNHLEASRQTREALVGLGQELYAAQPDVVVILTPHGLTVEGAFSLEVNDQLHGSLAEFGDIETVVTIPGAIGLAHRLKEAAEDANIPLLLQSHPGLDYGVTVPWLTLWAEPMTWPVIPLVTGQQSMDELVRLGTMLREFFQTRPERVAWIASGDTDRRATSMSGQDRRPSPVERKISTAIVKNDISDVTTIPLRANCLVAPLTVLLAGLQGLPGRGTIESFEVPLTVGQLVASFHLNV